MLGVDGQIWSLGISLSDLEIVSLKSYSDFSILNECQNLCSLDN